MSFSQEVKDEIVKKLVAKVDARPFLQGFMISSLNLVISSEGLSFVLSNENEGVIMLGKQGLETLFDDINVEISKVSKSFKQTEKFELSVRGDDAKRILSDFGFVKSRNGSIEVNPTGNAVNFSKESQVVAFLCGAFLGSGTVSVPSDEPDKRRYGYHFEIVFEQEEQAKLVLEMFSNLDIFPKKIQRNEQFVVYLKNSEAICDVLFLFGSTKAVLALQANKVERDVINATNRQTNCFTANVDKTVGAAVKQVRAIEVIKNTIGIENLPDTLAEAALARLANPESSLSDLLNVLEIKISKGALSQRFKRIIELAAELGDDDEKCD